MPDSESLHLFVPKSKPKSDDKSNTTTKSSPGGGGSDAGVGDGTSAKVPIVKFSSLYQPHQGGGFKKGTGYGGNESQSGAGWDIAAWHAAQMKRDSEIVEIARALGIEMEKATIPPSLAQTLEDSCLVPFLSLYLANDSISDMEKSPNINHAILDICLHMTHHPQLIRLFDRLPGDKKGLGDYMYDLRSSSLVAAKFEKFVTKDSNLVDHVSKNIITTPTLVETPSPSAHVHKKSKRATTMAIDQYPISLLQHIQQVAEAVIPALEKYKAEQAPAPSSSSGCAAASSSSASSAAGSSTDAVASSSSSSSSSGSLPVDYVSILSLYRFGEVDTFTSHHYFKQYSSSASSSSSVPNRQWVKRLASEYADLNKSLPIHPLSSAWLRYKEDAMAFSQFLIAAPDDTPYGFGLFLFDAYFPSTYPNVPPLVHLQTTGGGSVRFNPNLYADGKVCLSLLGTWSGANGENWSAVTSTFLQVIISIQSLILVTEPWYNEPGKFLKIH